MAGEPGRTGVLFVCLGNICRSPLAEAIFADLADRRGVRHRYDIDSCGLGGWHVGRLSDARSRAVALRNGMRLDRRARQIDPKVDFARFDVLVPMDASNRESLVKLGAPPERVRLIRSFDPPGPRAHHGDLDVPDPYHGSDADFEHVYRLLLVSCEGLLRHLLDSDKAGSSR